MRNLQSAILAKKRRNFNPRPDYFFLIKIKNSITSIKRPPPPPNLKHSVISQEKHVFTLFELLDEDCRSCSLVYNLIDEENDDEVLEIL